MPTPTTADHSAPSFEREAGRPARNIFAPAQSTDEIAAQFMEAIDFGDDPDPTPPSVSPADGEAARADSGASPEVPESSEPVVENPEEAVEPVEAADPATEEESGGIRTMGELAEAFGVEEDAVLSSIHITGEDGAEVPLAAVVDAWRSQPDAVAAAAERDEFEAQFDERQTQLTGEHDAQMRQALDLTQILQQQLIGSRIPASELAQLEQSDPEAAFRARNDQLQREEALRNALGQMRGHAEHLQKQDAERSQRVQSRELEKLGKVWPELVNPATADKTDAAIRQYLGGKGMRKAEIDGINSSAAFSIIRDAMRNSSNALKGETALRLAKEKGLKAPDLPPQARADAPGVNQLAADKLQGLHKKLQGSGDVHDAAAIFKEML